MHRHRESGHTRPRRVPDTAPGRAQGARKHAAAAALLLLFLAFLVGLPAAASAVEGRAPQLQITAPGGGGSYEEGSALTVNWTASGLTPGGRFGLWVDRQWRGLAEVVLPASRGPAYSAELVLAVPPGAGYSVVVAWRPATQSVGWKALARSAGTFRVTPAQPPSPDKAFTAFGFAGLTPPVEGVIDEASHTIALTVPSDTAVGALVASFTTTGVLVSVGGLPQVSGFTVNDFTSPVTYRVTAEDASTQDYVVTVTTAPGIQVGDHYGGGIVAWVFQPGQEGYVAGEIRGLIAAEANDVHYKVCWCPAPYDDIYTETGIGTGMANSERIVNHYRSRGLPDEYAAAYARGYRGGGYDDWYLPSRDELNLLFINRKAIGHLVESYWTSSQYIPPEAWQQSFTEGRTLGLQYVRGKHLVNGRVRAVRTFVMHAYKAITAFGFQGTTPPVVGTIDEAAHTITAAVPVGPDPKTLVATFSTTGAAVAVGGKTQTSGQTANDFTRPVTYTVTAQDGTTQDYVVTVYYVGESYQGGKIAYFLQPGDYGYVAGQVHGLIATAQDQTLVRHYQWSNVSSLLGTTYTGLSWGKANTAAIVGQAGCTGGAAWVCSHLNEGGYADWYLPSKDELNLLYRARYAIGGFSESRYWSSTEVDGARAWAQRFDRNAWQLELAKDSTECVRAIRSF